MDNLDDDVLEILENIVEDSIKPRKRKNWRGFTLEDFKDYYQEHHQGKKRSQVRKEDSSFYDAVNRRKLNDEIFPSFNSWINSGICTFTGHAFVQGASLQFKHLSASCIASSKLQP